MHRPNGSEVKGRHIYELRSKGRWICDDYIGLGHELLIDDAGVALLIECDARQVPAASPNRTQSVVAQGCEAHKLRDGGGA